MDDMLRLAETMCYSDVIINVFSTIVLDAIAFDTPVVGVAFDGKTTKDYYDSNRSHYDWTHVKPIVRSGAIRVAYDMDELVDGVNSYLENPSLDAQARMKVRKEQMLGLDGKSSRRAGQAVLRLMGLTGVREVKEEAMASVNISDSSSPCQD
jgi:CDP-glycerol glycerophosphotransferase (TagB/SpsB family)